MKTNARIIWLSIAAWACLLALTLYESALLPKGLVIEGIDFSAEMARSQSLIYLWIAVGGAVAIVGLLFPRWWIPATSISALVFLVVWFLRGPMSRVGPIDGYKLIWESAVQLHRIFPYLVRDLLVPTLQLLALALALLAWRGQLKMRMRSGSTS